MSFPPYPKYQSSGFDWLGSVPAHWTVRRIGNYFDERREKVSDTEFAALSVTKNGIVPQLDTAAKTDDNDNRKKVCAGDFVINSRSDRNGSSGLSELDGSVSLINIVLKPGSEVVGRYVHHLFRSEQFQQEFYRNGKGIVADLWSTNYLEMRNICIAVPPAAEQTRIAAFLDRETAKINALVAEQEKLIALLKEKRQALISHAVTKGLDPNVPMKDSSIEWLGQVPAHWSVVRLKFIATVQSGIAKGKDVAGVETRRLPYMRVANVQDGYLELNDIAEIDVAVGEVDRYKLQRGDVLMNEGGDFDKLGRGAIWNGEIPNCIHQNHVFAVRPHGVASAWLNAVTGSDYAQFYFMSRSKQSTNLASISSTNLMELPVVLPPEPEQPKILSFITTHSIRFDRLESEARGAVALLKERRNALISAAVTGKIDVRGSVSA